MMKKHPLFTKGAGNVPATNSETGDALEGASNVKEIAQAHSEVDDNTGIDYPAVVLPEKLADLRPMPRGPQDLDVANPGKPSGMEKAFGNERGLATDGVLGQLRKLLYTLEGSYDKPTILSLIDRVYDHNVKEASGKQADLTPMPRGPHDGNENPNPGKPSNMEKALGNERGLATDGALGQLRKLLYTLEGSYDKPTILSLVDRVYEHNVKEASGKLAFSGGDFYNGYVQAALWSSTTDDGSPMDQVDNELAPETIAAMQADCDSFEQQAGGLIEEDNFTGSADGSIESRAGHDFWLTRNGHGAGFWDGDWEEPVASQLTDLSKSFGEFDLYIGDDGLIYASGHEGGAPEEVASDPASKFGGLNMPKAAAEVSTGKAVKLIEELAEDLQKLFMKAKVLTTVNNTRPVRDAVDSIYASYVQFGEISKILMKQEAAEKAEEELAAAATTKGKKSSVVKTAWGEEPVEGSCFKCGNPMQVSPDGVANHLDEQFNIDYEADADHVALLDDPANFDLGGSQHDIGNDEISNKFGGLNMPVAASEDEDESKTAADPNVGVRNFRRNNPESRPGYGASPSPAREAQSAEFGKLVDWMIAKKNTGVDFGSIEEARAAYDAEIGGDKIASEEFGTPEPKAPKQASVFGGLNMPGKAKTGATRNDRVAFVTSLQQHAPNALNQTLSSHTIQSLGDSLMRLGGPYKKIQQNALSGALDQTAKLKGEEKEHTIQEQVTALATQLGCTPRFEGDPAGATIYIMFPDGHSNGAGQGISVPTS